mmetsp:Transcript_13311/g.21802  ORF Transcript_13311/g.21802 Transcript_13311/m.21802 type:complete len:1154 (-) Transcript_13311:142-3603(-)
MSGGTGGAYRLRVYFNFGKSKKNYKNYELFHLRDKNETFESLKRKVFRKLNIDISNEHHFYFSLQRLYTIEKGGKCLRPKENESVYYVIEREELRWAGSLIVIVNDLREEMRCMTKTEELFDDYEFIESPPTERNGVVSALDWIPDSTEFSHQNIISYSTVYSQVDNMSSFELSGGSSIPSQFVNEIEMSSLKSGRMFKLHNVNGKESYKDMYSLLTTESLWFRPYVANPSFNSNCVLQEIALVNTTVVVATDLDSSGCTFTITTPFENGMILSSLCIQVKYESADANQCIYHTFKTKSASECQSWVDSINQRGHLSAENDIISMADTFAASLEEESSLRDIDVLVDCTTFEGTLKNGYMREKLQRYLGHNCEDELLLFWEYCEDYRKGHPESDDPFDFSHDFEQGSTSISIDATSKAQSSQTASDTKVEVRAEVVKVVTAAHSDPKLVLTWARFIYNKFIVDGAPMQIACPSMDRTRIEDILRTDSAPTDLFYHVQTQIYNQLKFQKFTDFIKISNFRKVLLSTVMNKINQCQVSGQIWRTIAPSIPSKLVTSPADFYPSIFPMIESFRMSGGSSEVTASKKYNLLSWSPGQFDMDSFLYSDSLKYEIEKDYINNYGQIPLDTGVSIASENDARKKRAEPPVRFPRFASFVKNFGKKEPSPDIITEEERFTSGNGSELRFDVADLGERTGNTNALQSVIPTPWRFVGETGEKLSSPPHWMPMYWWRYVNPNVSQTYDQSYDEQMFDMLPEWIKCIVIDKIRSSDVTEDGSAINKSSLLRNYTRAVSKVQNVKKVDESKTSAEPSKPLSNDFIMHTASSPTATGISFTTCGGYGQQSQRITVPHLARLSHFREQWATLPIPGRIVMMTYMLVSYTNRSSRTSYSSRDQSQAKLSVSEEHDDDMEIERQSVIDSASVTDVSQQAVLSNSSRRLCVLSYANGKDNSESNDYDGELRLYGSNYSDLYAVIRLSTITKISPSTNLMNMLEITDEGGAIWHLCPEDVSIFSNCANISSNNYKLHIRKLESKKYVSIVPEPSPCRIWLHHLSLLCSSRAYTVHILHEGFISKRGRLNTAFRRRWFIMTSEMVLLYYSRSETAGQSKFKGALNILDVLDVVINENGKDFVIHTSSRDWVVKADTEKEALSWKQAIMVHIS